MKKESELENDWEGVEIHHVRILRKEIYDSLKTKFALKVVRKISDVMESANDGKPDDAAFEIAMLALRYVRSIYHYNSLRSSKQKAEYWPKVEKYANFVFERIDDLEILDEEWRWERTEYSKKE